MLIKYAEHGASGFFDIVQVKEEELEKLYKFDLSLTESINHISKQIEKVKEIIRMDDTNVKSFVNELMDTLNKFDEHLDSRKQCILEVK